MSLSRSDIQAKFDAWLQAFNDHDLEGVLDFMHDEIIFEHWNAGVITGKDNLRKVWTHWFGNDGNFKFTLEKLFIDERLQGITFSWQLDWPSAEKKYAGQAESRKGMDIMQLKDGKIFLKNTYSKTVLSIGSKKISLTAD